MIKRLLVLTLLCLVPLPVLAAGTCALTEINDTKGSVVRVVVTFTADADDADSTAWECNFGPSGLNIMKYLDGAYIYRVSADPGATGPTDESDFTGSDLGGRTFFSPSGHGLNFIDNSTNTGKWTEDEAGNDWAYPVSEENSITWAITNNAVESAVTVVTILADRSK